MVARKAKKKVSTKKLGNLAKPQRRTQTKKLAGTIHTVKEPLVDVTQHVREKIVAAPAPKAEPTKHDSPLTHQERQELDAHFARELAHEPKKQGFFKRLLGKD